MLSPYPGSALETVLRLFLLGSLQWQFTVAQITSNATCLPGLAVLEHTSEERVMAVQPEYDVSELAPGRFYVGPPADSARPCECSTVMYAVMSACGACQNASEILSWDSWSASCLSVYITVFPEDIPRDTAVPGWAYENNTVTNFDPQTALDDHSPESSASPSQTVTSASPPSSTSQIADASPSSPTNNTGTLIGAILGCVAGLSLVGGIAFFLVRHNRRKSGGHVRIISAADDSEENVALQETRDYTARRMSLRRSYASTADAVQTVYHVPAPPASLAPHSVTLMFDRRTPSPGTSPRNSLYGTGSGIGVEYRGIPEIG
ncbi:hypothetical protein EW145_g5539 [Phellinidium pouzarii]|uniref:Uncharacterized protein n=1 Tax=Phellinidium pouzarii TaxID=167371 RepID=A0A4S4L0X3_9AGAM|nr:hypothetical protein EW145_g5539 [Phellinidium pouzarii]